MEMSTAIAGYEALSTWPTSCLATTAVRPTSSRSLLCTLQVTVGMSRGSRPYTSRSMSSTISGRRSVHHCSAVVTGLPFLRVRTSGRTGYGFASDSSDRKSTRLNSSHRTISYAVFCLKKKKKKKKKNKIKKNKITKYKMTKKYVLNIKT